MNDDDDDADLPCSYKETFPNRETAMQIYRTYQRNYGSRSQVYCCHLCGQWHITAKRNRGGAVERTLQMAERQKERDAEILNAKTGWQ